MKKAFLIMLALLTAFSARAQFASLGGEKSSTAWQQIETGNYRVIFPVGLDSLGARYSELLETYRPYVGASAGFLPNQQYKGAFPVILHPFGAVANGAVVWAPRSCLRRITTESAT